MGPDATSNNENVAMVLSDSRGSKWLLTLPRIAGGPFTGTGDLTAAMLLAWMHRHPHEPAEALEKTGAVLQNVIRKTVSMNAARRVGEKLVPPELRLINCKGDIEKPAILTRCRLIHPPEQRFQGMVFDLDGTLTLPGQINFQRMRERTGVPIGKDIVPYLRELHAGDNAALEAALAIVDEEERRAFDPPLLQEGVKSCLEIFSARGFRLGIFTRNSLASVKAFLSHAGLSNEMFAPVVTRDSGIPNKPDPAPVAHCCKAWGLDPASVLVVGDHVDDMASGKAAGAATCGMLPPPAADGDGAARLAGVADFVVSSVDALRRLVPE